MKISKILRKISVFLLVYLIMHGFSSCSFYMAQGDGEDSRLSLSTLDVPVVGEADVPMSGIALPSVYRVISEKGDEENFFASPEDTDIFSKTVFERNSRLYTDHSVTLELKTVGELVSYARNAYLSETTDYNMMLVGSSDAAALISNSVCADLASVAGFSEKGRGYASRVIEELSLGGRIYLAAGDATPSLLRSTSAVMVNTDLLSRIEGGDQLMRTVKSGKFTYETMLKLSLGLKELNGAEGDSTYGIKVGNEDALSLFLGGGGRFYINDDVTDMPHPVDFGDSNRQIYGAFMKLYGYDVESEGGVAYGSSQRAATPLFTLSNIGRIEALAMEKAPFKALPLPKLNEKQTEYISNADLESVIFTALPAGIDNAGNAAVMNLIYSTSEGISKLITDNCEGISFAENSSSESEGTVSMIKNSLSASVFSLFDYGDLHSLLSESIAMRLSGKVFEMRGNERSAAASAALSILISSAE